MRKETKKVKKQTNKEIILNERKKERKEGRKKERLK